MAESISTQDPRITDLLEHRGELTPDGEPTRLALMAERARRHLDDVERLRAELSVATRETQELETRVVDSEEFEQRGGKHKEVLVDQLIDVRARAALSSSSGAGASLRRQYSEKQSLLKEYERDTAEQGERLERLKRAARDKARQVKRIRESISRQLGLLESVLGGVETGVPVGGQGGAPSAGRARRPGRRVIRRIRRRR